MTTGASARVRTNSTVPASSTSISATAEARCIGEVAATGSEPGAAPWWWAPLIGRCTPTITRFIAATSTQARTVSRVHSS
ncbi:Uncharacterised protein [Mycolicibacterium vanbaalenii]|uniref:Uncharacterized protein n=1 Tax=Mycolicibacterium vanbaalenii TaxID=110539 RepID=A0A5S9R9R8_MYCVN|nr:Uncharacterised protein [Mycolicibacterium vanbaalenii]